MSELSDRVIASKNVLMSALGDNAEKYLFNMKLWFRSKWSKEKFDIESRRLLTPEKMNLHNNFLVAILNKVDTFVVPQQHAQAVDNITGGSRSSRKRKRCSKFFGGERSTFEPYDLYDYLLDDNNLEASRPANSIDDDSASAPKQRYCAQELFLPNAGFMMGRLLVGAWENGLINVDDIVAEYVVTAVQILLKNILTAITLKRKHYSATGEGTFFYDVGRPMKDPFVRNTITRQKIVDSPIELDKEITSASANVLRRSDDDSVFLSSCEELFPQEKNIITIQDVYKALRDKNTIQSHTVYTINLERISQMLH